ncbi:amino acid ABC transporter permease [Jeotgalibaca sp. MA1X17-3]|uniref:amino acid ABC transporter permease n=1 Tax=Jeotgalibaca sp. MA1X17-3 TaxID=2908211 RepID=UPI001F1E0E77|nr:amino acid ABC transporter permease [Jeotgalibaca sp. MA1X17-3]UJF16363.1 amino acid ABC transporter permease [Jeotgalibaca sp. MA1X17-3]
MSIEFLRTYLPLYFQGAGYTVALSLIAIVIGVLLGSLLAIMKMSDNRFIYHLSNAYIQVVRGTPLLVQLFIIYYGLFMIIELPDFVSGVITVALNSAAYIAEIIRAGIQAVDKGQMEAARSIGMSHNLAMKKIIYPQALKNILPALGNEFITLMKESAIISVIGMRELMFNAQIVYGATYKPFLPYIIAAVFYFVLTTIASTLLGIFERRLKQSD